MDKIRIYIALLFCLTLSFIHPVHAQDTSGSNRYNTQYSYDSMGNITSLSRNGLLDDWSGAYRFYVKDYQFDEGYCQAERYNTSMDSFTFCYYDRDHLGDIRQVREADGSRSGEVIQKINYYPFGAQFCDGVAVSNVQSRKYNGKEYDNMHGLNTYDYGARQYNPITVRWDRMDTMCEKYYDFSPYAYCHNNPIMLVDLDGMDDYYDIYGNYLGTNKEDTDNIYIAESYIKKGSSFVIPINKRISISDAKIDAEAYSKIFSNTLKMMGVNLNNLIDNKIQVAVWNYENGLKVSTDYTNNASFKGDALATFRSDEHNKAITQVSEVKLYNII